MSSPSLLRDHHYRPDDPSVAFAISTERLYSAFASVPFDPAMPHSPGSVSAADVASLGAPVASLPPELVSRFVLKAGTTWGAPDDVRRVAPRALHLAAEHQLPIDGGLLWAKLRWAGWPHWPSYQTLTMRAFLRAEWGRLLRSDPRPAHLAHRWLRQAADGVDDLGPFLDDWHDALGPLTPSPHHRAATGHLVVLLVGSPLRPDHPPSVRDLVPAHPAAADQLGEWLAGPGTDDALRRAAEVLASTSDGRRVAVARERLGQLRAVRARLRAGAEAADTP